MLGIFLIYWVGKKYYNLAGYYGKNEWGHVFMALGLYFGSQFIFGILGAVFFPDFFESLASDSSKDLLLNLSGIGIGLLVWYTVHEFLENKYANAVIYDEGTEDEDISTIGEDLDVPQM